MGFIWAYVRKILDTPLLNSVVKALLVQVILWSGGVMFRSPEIRFLGPIQYGKDSCLLWIIKPMMTEAVERARITIEFSKPLNCLGTAVKLSRDRRALPLICSGHTDRRISWDAIETTSGREQIAFNPDEIIKIQLASRQGIFNLNIQNIYVTHKQGAFTLTGYKFKKGIMRVLNAKVLVTFLLITLILIYPYALHIRRKQQQLLKACLNDEIKPMIEFAKKYNRVIYKVMQDNEWTLVPFLTKNIGFEEVKDNLLRIIARSKIFMNWKNLPQLGQSLVTGIRDNAIAFLSERWVFYRYIAREKKFGN